MARVISLATLGASISSTRRENISQLLWRVWVRAVRSHRNRRVRGAAKLECGPSAGVALFFSARRQGLLCLRYSGTIRFGHGPSRGTLVVTRRIRERLYDACRHAEGHRSGRHVLHDHGVRAYHREVADMHRPKDARADADADVVADLRLSFFPGTATDRDELRDEAVVADLCAGMDEDTNPAVTEDGPSSEIRLRREIRRKEKRPQLAKDLREQRDTALVQGFPPAVERQ